MKLRWLALLVLALVSLPAAPLRADDTPQAQPAKRVLTAKEKRAAQAEARRYAVDPRTSKVLAKAREELAAEKFEQARATLGKLRIERLSLTGRAQVNRMLGYIAYGQQQNAVAIEHLEKSLAEDGLVPADRVDVLFQVAQIQAVERRWKDVIASLEKWFKSVERPNSVGYFLTAVAYYQLEDLDSALLPAKKAVELAKKPQPAWLQLLLALHLTQKDYAAATPVALELVTQYPEVGKSYWLQLSALYSTIEQPERALAVLELAYHKGLLSDDRDLRRLVQFTLFQKIPNRAAEILEKEMAAKRITADAEALELLSSSWILARETPKAEEPLVAAAELAPKGNLYVRLAQVHLLQEEWGKATDSLRKALAKGGLDDPGTAQLLLGVSYFNEKKYQEARTWFTRAQQSAATRKQAQTWIEHVERELRAGA